ncbi:LAME_0C01222g1_1 [Lachancea meyersii CBS 8951]|uniref:Cargo-transport protein YPP1 n=1 Tax=Lachancea meyersii CBS 8951 TaxID=1266667 RepID=A0A1G4IZ53_9SACH|nr:LAME_0C01222g1_1 [Lachancea meyersii CBS 8951]
MTQKLEDNSNALQDRLLGCGVFNCPDKQLNALLSLQYRTHYHVFGGNTANKSVFEVLQGELSKCDYSGSSNAIKKRIGLNLQGILSYHLSATESAQNHLVLADQVKLGPGPFETFLQLETLYFTGLLKGNGSVEHYLQNLLEVVTELPRESHALTFHYLDLIVARLQMNWDQLLERLKPCNVTYYVAVQSNTGNHDQELLKIGFQLLKAASFPTAEECNNRDLEQFHVVLQYYFLNCNASTSTKWRDFLIESMGKTFQSMEVAKTAMVYFGLEQQKNESILNFVNFMSYNENYKELNDGRWLDTVSILESYRFVAEQAGHVEIPNIFNFYDFLTKFKAILREFYAKISLPLIEKEQSLDIASNGAMIFIPQKLRRVLAQSWNSLYEYERDDLSSVLQSSHTHYLANAHTADPNSDALNFSYAYALAQKREIAQAIKFIKNAILEKEPENYRAWHLLALCESTNEDKTISFRIVCSVLQALQQALHDGTSLSVSERWQMIHLKVTQLKITADMFGVEDALELLPELMELLDLALPSDLKDCSLGPEFNKSKEYLQQSVWLFAVQLYMSRSVEDAREALAESKIQTTKFHNLNNDLAEGYMSLAGDKGRALESFEKVLFYDPMNIDAIVGFAKCLMPGTDEEELHKMTPPKTYEPSEDAFLSEKDRSAAFARLKLLLEEIIEKSIEGYYSPEIWWYLAQVYENYGDQERMELSLWNCVKFQELRPIRDFKICNI